MRDERISNFETSDIYDTSAKYNTFLTIRGETKTVND